MDGEKSTGVSSSRSSGRIESGDDSSGRIESGDDSGGRIEFGAQRFSPSVLRVPTRRTSEPGLPGLDRKTAPESLLAPVVMLGCVMAGGAGVAGFAGLYATVFSSMIATAVISATTGVGVPFAIGLVIALVIFSAWIGLAHTLERKASRAGQSSWRDSMPAAPESPPFFI